MGARRANHRSRGGPTASVASCFVSLFARYPMTYKSMMGAQVKRKEDPRLITGKAIYTGDLRFPDMRHVVFVRSPYAHARIRGLDVSRALKRPGVTAVVS